MQTRMQMQKGHAMRTKHKMRFGDCHDGDGVAGNVVRDVGDGSGSGGGRGDDYNGGEVVRAGGGTKKDTTKTHNTMTGSRPTTKYDQAM